MAGYKSLVPYKRSLHNKKKVFRIIRTAALNYLGEVRKLAISKQLTRKQQLRLNLNLHFIQGCTVYLLVHQILRNQTFLYACE